LANDNKEKKYGSVEDIFILCETCYWCATYFDKSRLPTEKCPMCLNDVEMSSFLPILHNEAFTFNYNHKLGVELNLDLGRNNKNGQ
jgi:hypothetical protein